MKTLIRTIVILSALVGAAACQQFEIDTQMTPEQEYANLRLVCDAVDSYQLASTGADAVTFNVSANTPWTITRSSGAEWCTVTPSSSSNSSLISDVMVSVADNDGEDRTATLTIRGERINKYYTITINQSRKGHLYVTPFAKDFSAAGGPLSFTVNTNVPWTVRTDVSWLKFNRENGNPDPDGKTITIIATADPSDVLERLATVTVVAGDDEESFEVTQKATFEMTEISGEFPGAGGTQALKLRTDLPWTVSADKDWISFDKEEGAGDGGLTVINVTAKPNEDVARKAVITVRVAGEEHAFEVRQSGVSFNIVPLADPTIPREGGELVIEVNASMDWTPRTDVPGFSVEKVDNSHFKVVAGFNNRFAPRKGAVSIVSASGATDSVELTQDVNFSFEGHYEILEDGSVKVYVDQKTRVTLIDPARYVSFVLTMGEVSFDDKAEFVLNTHDANGGEMQCQIRLGAGKNRLRTNGGATEYNTQNIGITKDQLNAMTEYRMDFRPNAEDSGKVDLEFFYNGSSMALMTSKSPYAGYPDAVSHYFFGCEDAASGSATWYIVKSCDVTFIEG